ncbi:MAG: aminopeptidase [Clostridia bacterium]|nr:aminopeptidase [Clostridia bacterium]
MPKESTIKEYAKLLVNVGINIQKGQKLVINCPVDCAYFARMLTTEAYASGAKDVLVNWRDDYVSREHWLKADDSVFDELYPWDVQKRYDLVNEGAGFISVAASDPENLKGVDPDRLVRADRAFASNETARRSRDMMMANFSPWCVASVPVLSWARKVFPGTDDDTAMEKLWDEILSASRVKDGGDAVAEWRTHCFNIESKARKMTELKIRRLRYKNSLGTDLEVEMPEDHVWIAGGDTSKAGIRFVANIPTEEVFSAPKKDGVNGVICASKPLVVNGNLVDGIRFRLEKGRIVEIHADRGEDILRKAVDTDDASHYLGEIALVPYDSPISNSGILFYNTLFDENAACHFAFGNAYPACIKGGDDLPKEYLEEKGLNLSSTMHEDFMVGTADLSITAETRDGKTVEIFRNGNFAF